MPVEIEIWPTSVAFEPGERLVLEVASEDDPRMEPFLHNDPIDRKQSAAPGGFKTRELAGYAFSKLRTFQRCGANWVFLREAARRLNLPADTIVEAR